jgi:hypothetical protein
MSPDGFLRNTWTDILGTGGRFPPEHMDTFPGIGIYSRSMVKKRFLVSNQPSMHSINGPINAMRALIGCLDEYT